MSLFICKMSKLGPNPIQTTSSVSFTLKSAWKDAKTEWKNTIVHVVISRRCHCQICNGDELVILVKLYLTFYWYSVRICLLFLQEDTEATYVTSLVHSARMAEMGYEINNIYETRRWIFQMSCCKLLTILLVHNQDFTRAANSKSL